MNFSAVNTNFWITCSFEITGNRGSYILRFWCFYIFMMYLLFLWIDLPMCPPPLPCQLPPLLQLVRTNALTTLGAGVISGLGGALTLPLALPSALALSNIVRFRLCQVSALLNLPWTFPECSLNVPWMCPGWLLLWWRYCAGHVVTRGEHEVLLLGYIIWSCQPSS
jgi:hypothetical protein